MLHDVVVTSHLGPRRLSEVQRFENILVLRTAASQIRLAVNLGY